MKQIFLKSSFDLGWASSDYRVALGGQGETAFSQTFGVNYAKVVVPIAGIFRNLVVYSPAGTHPNYSATLIVNGVPTALTCSILSTDSIASDIIHSVNVLAGDDIYFSVNVNPFGSGVGYSMNLSVEFEGAQQFYSITANAGGQNAGTYTGGGALGNGVSQNISLPSQLSNTYSICTTPGNITGIAMKAYSTNAGGSWTAFIVKNGVLQDGTAGSVNTACTLIDGVTQIINSFSLPIAITDHLDCILLRNTTNAPFALANVTLSVIFNPTDASSFMACGGNNDGIDNSAVSYKWLQSKQLEPSELIVQCPVGPRGLTIKGLYIELAGPPGLAKGFTYTLRKNGTDTTATVTISDTTSITTGSITGLVIPYVDGDFIDLELTPINHPPAIGLKWGLMISASDSVPSTDLSGIYSVIPGPGSTHDVYNGPVNKKIPNPTIKTALIGE